MITRYFITYISNPGREEKTFYCEASSAKEAVQKFRHKEIIGEIKSNYITAIGIDWDTGKETKK